MARHVDVREKRSNPANPSFLGEDLEAVLWQAAGLGGTAYVNDKFVAPMSQRVIPAGGGAMAKLLDAITTALSAWAVGEGVGFVDKKVGRWMKHGGFILAGGKGLSVLLPSFSISATVPNFLPQNAPKALPAASANSNGTATLVRVGRLGI